VAKLDGIFDASHEPATFAALFKMTLECLVCGSEDYTIEESFEKPVKLVAIKHHTARCRGKDSILQHHGRGHWYVCEFIKCDYRATNIVVCLATFTTAESMGRTFSPRTHIQRAVEVIRDVFLKSSAVH
jgi:hypothetical protein